MAKKETQQISFSQRLSTKTGNGKAKKHPNKHNSSKRAYRGQGR